MTDNAVFLFEATRRLFSSLSPDVALWEFYNYIKQRIPLHEFNLNKALPHILAGYSIARVTDAGPQCEWAIHATTVAQQALWQKMIRENPPDGAIRRMVLGEEDDVYQYFVHSPREDGRVGLKLPAFFLRLVWDKAIIGSANFQVSRVLSEEEQDLLRSLEAPLCSALTNMVQFRELADLKEQLTQDNERLRRKLSGLDKVEIIGQRSGLRDVMRKVRMTAPVDVPVLISGETGTGKDVIAKAIHELSQRKDRDFIPVNCGAIPPSLIDSELFGHVKGAFTGAEAGHKGRFERADGGTLFLDEVGELPLEVQARLLRVLESGEVERVGSSSPVKVNIRLLAATHRDLPRMVREGTFREDLYYRLRVVDIHVPPLRRRKEDIPKLVLFLLRRSVARYGVTMPLIRSEEMERLARYDWPGNVRELQNILDEALICSNGQPLRFSLGFAREQEQERSQEMLQDMDGVMRDYLTRLLRACHGRVDGPHGAALIAGLTPSTFRFKCKKLGIEPRRVL